MEYRALPSVMPRGRCTLSRRIDERLAARRVRIARDKVERARDAAAPGGLEYPDPGRLDIHILWRHLGREVGLNEVEGLGRGEGEPEARGYGIVFASLGLALARQIPSGRRAERGV